MQKITPFLWFNHNAEDAVNFYVSVFKDSKIVNTSRYSEGMPLPAGTVLTVTLEINGQEFIALNGGPGFAAFTPAISFFIKCEDQAEVDHYWDSLLEGGSAMQCGWLTDKYGITWQVVPTILTKLMQDENPDKARATAQAMMKMVKLDVAGLQKAYDEA